MTTATTRPRSPLATPLAALLTLGVIVALGLAADVPLPELFRDPHVVTGSHSLVGVVSNLGALLWCATASICLFTASAVFERGGHNREARFLLLFGLFTAALFVDDFFMLHDRLLPESVGIPGWILFPLYALILLAGGFKYADRVARTDYRPAMLALTFFGLSMVIDALQPQFQALLGQWRIALEDGLKFLGIVSWGTYWVRVCLDALTATTRVAAQEP